MTVPRRKFSFPSTDILGNLTDLGINDIAHYYKRIEDLEYLKTCATAGDVKAQKVQYGPFASFYIYTQWTVKKCDATIEEYRNKIAKLEEKLKNRQGKEIKPCTAYSSTSLPQSTSTLTTSPVASIDPALSTATIPTPTLKELSKNKGEPEKSYEKGKNKPENNQEVKPLAGIADTSLSQRSSITNSTSTTDPVSSIGPDLSNATASTAIPAKNLENFSKHNQELKEVYENEENKPEKKQLVETLAGSAAIPTKKPKKLNKNTRESKKSHKKEKSNPTNNQEIKPLPGTTEPALHVGSQADSRERNILPMPLSGPPLLGQEVNLTIHAKSAQVITERELTAPVGEKEAELRQQLLFSEQRKLLDDFLLDVQQTLKQMAELCLHGLSTEQRKSILEPQIFLSYAWEASSARLKQLQDVFLRHTLAADLARVGLSPWLDVEKMVGHMDGQMRDNVTDSQFVVLLGTQRYAERTKIEKCGLLHLPLSSFKDKDSVENLPIEYNNFYLRVDKQLFYVGDKAKNQYKAVELAHEDDLTVFDGTFNLSSTTTPKSKQLTSAELATITRITRHERRTNVRKELEFTLEQAKKSNDFLLPLLLEGDWGSTFPEISKDYLVLDSRSWFSLEKGWLNFEDYIHGLTQLAPLGILPTVLGMSRTKEHSEYRKAFQKAYKNLYSNLALKLRLLSSSPMDKKLSSATSSNTISTTTSSCSTPPPVTNSASSSSSINSSSTLLPSSSPSFSLSSASSPSTTTSSSSPIMCSNNPPLGALPSGLQFFQQQKPAVIKTEAPTELKNCIGNFQELFDEHLYTFTVKRASKEQLVVQFTARRNVVEDNEEIQDQLQPAAIKLRQLANASGLNIKSKQCKLDWNAWTLTINATSDEIEGIAWLLQTASGKYIIKDNKPSDHGTTCRLQ